MIKVLVSGGSGFLLRNTLPDYNWDIIDYEYGEEYQNIDIVVHFASPTDVYDFRYKEDMAIGMIDLTLKMVDESLANNCKMIFASSMAAEVLDDEYGIYKRAMEQYIQAIVPDHLILRIPRVYGVDKNKGLMKRIKLNDIKEDDWDKEIEYIDIEDFKIWFNKILNKNSVQLYNKKFRKNTILELKEKYCES